MGLSKKVSLDNGITVDNAYFRLDTISGCKNNISIGINCYNSREDFLNGKSYLQPTKYYNFIPDITSTSKNFIIQAYDALLKLDEFKTATIVLEDGQSV